ncbi:tail tubular protein A [Caudoviricetes sp.]|nr:tail tubular protein A [Caudoviricetes sp.]
MATTGTLESTSQSTVTESGYRPWTSPTNAQTVNATSATAALTSSGNGATTFIKTERLLVSGFGTTIPTGATILGVEVLVERRGSTATDITDDEIYLYNGSTVIGSNKADTTTPWPISYAGTTYGSTSDLWGATLTPSIINATGFGVVLRAKNTTIASTRTAYVDAVRIAVTYSSGYTLTGTSKTTTFTKQTATLTTARKIVGTAKTTTFTKQSATLKVGRAIVGTAKTATFTKRSATLSRTRVLLGNAKSTTFTKQTATVKASRVITGTAKTTTFTKKDASLTVAGGGYTLTGTAKTTTFTKRSASLLAYHTLTGTVKTATFTKRTATATVSRKIIGASKATVFLKKDANLFVSGGGYILSGLAKTATFTKQNATLRFSHILTGLPKTATFTKEVVLLTLSRYEQYDHYAEICEGVYDVPTATGICNQALGLIGASNMISSLAEDSIEARACNAYYHQTRLEVLQAVPWPFVRRQQLLALVGASVGTTENPDGLFPLPEDGWTYTYAYPCDCLKPILIKPSTDGTITTSFSNTGDMRDGQNTIVPFIETTRKLATGGLQRVISTNKQTALLVYQANVIDPSVFPPEFIILLVQSLASKLAMTLTGDKQMAQLHSTITQDMIKTAQHNNNTEYNVDKRPTVYDPTPEVLRMAW